MSAFTNWNGPDCGCNGPSLPQIQTLEELIAKYEALRTDVDTLIALVRPFVGDPAINNSINAVKTQIGTGTAGMSDLVTAITQLQNILPKSAFVDSSGQITQTVQAAIQAVSANLGNVSNVVTAVQQLANSLNTYDNAQRAAGFFLTTVTENGAPKDRILLDSPKFKDYYDFVEWVRTPGNASWHGVKRTYNISSAYIPPTAAQIAAEKAAAEQRGETYKYELQYLEWLKREEDTRYFSNTIILGMLSTDWKSQTVGKYGATYDGVEPKSGRAYVKLCNTVQMSAVIDMAVTKNRTSGTVCDGAMFATINKQFANTVRFGLYESTDSTGRVNVYLGVKVRGWDTFGGPQSFYIPNPQYDPNQPISPSNQEYIPAPAAGFAIPDFDVAGENFIPRGHPSYIECNNNVRALCEVNGKANNGSAVAGYFEVDVLQAGYIYAEKIYAKEMVTLDENGNEIILIKVDGDTIIIGDSKHDLLLHSKNRPTVIHEDGSRHLIGYITDMAQSVFYKGAVACVAEDMAELTALKVKADMTNPGAPVFVDPATPVGGNIQEVPGFYTLIDTAKQDFDGVIFQNLDIALIRNGKTDNRLIPDGMVNLESVPNYQTQTIIGPLSKRYVTGVDWSKAKAGTILTSTDQPGPNGNIWVVTAITNPDPANPNMGDFTISNNPAPTQHNYILPGYVRFAGTAWEAAPYDYEAVPETFDGFISEITYQWAGPLIKPRVLPTIGQVSYGVQAYSLWTALFQNNTTMNYAGYANDWGALELLVNVIRPLPVPVGSIIDWPMLSSGVPLGWLPCDNAAYDQSTYPDLYSIIGDDYATPNNPPPSGQFRVPLQNNSIIRWNPIP